MRRRQPKYPDIPSIFPDSQTGLPDTRPIRLTLADARTLKVAGEHYYAWLRERGLPEQDRLARMLAVLRIEMDRAAACLRQLPSEE